MGLWPFWFDDGRGYLVWSWFTQVQVTWTAGRWYQLPALCKSQWKSGQQQPGSFCLDSAG